MNASTVSARVIPLVRGALGARGIDPAPILARIGLGSSQALDHDARISHAETFALFDAAADAANDPAFGLHVAEHLRPGSLGVVDYLIRSATTLGEALAMARRYQRLIQDAELVLETRRDLAIQRYSLSGGWDLPPAVAECVIGGAVVWTRQMTGRPVDPLEVRFAHRRPRDTTEHDRILRAPVRFGARENVVIFSAPSLDLPLLGADRGLMTLLEQQAADLLHHLPRRDRFIDRVRDLMACELRTHAPSLPRIAARLHVSSRTLRRRLRAEGTSPWRLLDDLRHDLAVRHLGAGELEIGEIAFQLGFSDASAFHKAFRRWTGRGPAAFRQSTGAPGH